MKVHRISLRNYRGVTEADVGLAGTGVTIVEGDNEVGKSSLVEALRLILDAKDSSLSKVVKAVRPVGRDVGAEVEVDMSTGPYRFTYRKVWGRGRETVLSVTSPTRRQLTGVEAHEAVRDMLAETLDLALFDALQRHQGAELAQADYSMRSLGHALDQAASADQAGDREDGLWDQIVAERDRYWTATGKPKTERTALAERLAQATTLVADADAALRALDARSEELGRLQSEASSLTARHTDLEAQERDLAARAGAVDALRQQVQTLTERRDARAAEAQSRRHQQDRRAELVTRVDSSSRHLTELEQRSVGTAAARSQVGDRHQALQATADAAATAVREGEDRHRLSSGDADHRRHEIELAQLGERRDRVAAAEDTLTRSDAILDAASVDDQQVMTIERAHLQVVRAEAAASAAGAGVVLRGLGDSEVFVDGVRHRLSTGDELAFSPSDPSGLELVVPGALSLTVRPGSEGLALAGAADDARRSFSRLCQQAGVTDLDHARAVAGARAGAQRDRDQAASAVRDNLRDLTSEALVQKVKRLSARIDAYRRDRPATPALPTDLDTAQAQAREAAASLDHWREELDRLHGEASAAAAQVQTLDIDDAGLTAETAIARTTLAGAGEALCTARVERSDQSVAADLTTAEHDLSEATEALQRRQDALADEDPEGLDVLVANARAARVRGHEALNANRERCRSLQAVLESHGEQGLARQRDDAITVHQHLAHEVAAIERRAEAAQLLFDRFAARRDEARTRYAAPFRSRIEQLGRLVFGPSLEIELAPDLRIATRTLDGVTVTFDQLSSGAQEQLDLLSRLACAAIVSDGGGAPVVFDDALGWTDPGRLEKMGAALDFAGRSCQIIVLTCTPDRYAAVGNATVIRLPGGWPLAEAASA